MVAVLGGEYSGDIKIEINGMEMIGEVKYRDKSNFPSPFSVLEGRDIAFYKRRKGTPQTLVIMTGEQFQLLMEESYGIAEQDDQGLRRADRRGRRSQNRRISFDDLLAASGPHQRRHRGYTNL